MSDIEDHEARYIHTTAGDLDDKPVRALVDEHNVARHAIDELATHVLGTPRTELEGGGRNPDGMVHKVDRLIHMADNGGFPAKLSRKQLIGASSFGVAVLVDVMARVAL